ncbi:MAG: adenosine deaminase [Clostridia bacterium]|nr:adenosine deaminase [Clostridia bacterium]
MIDLHMHLNGSLSTQVILKIAREENVSLPTYDEKELQKLISVPKNNQSLNDYLKCTAVPRLVTQTEKGIENAVYYLLEELAEQGLIYTEIRFAPQRHRDNGLTQEQVVLSAIKGVKKSRIKASLILCCMRGDNLFEENLETVNLAEKYLNKGVGGLDLAGAEAKFKTIDYKDLFDIASKKNIPFTIHAGEADGAKSVSDAIDFGARRIGHGIRSIEDDEVISKLIKNNVYLEICPSSNLQTRAVEGIEQYPFRKLLEKGVKLTVNTDNKNISDTTLIEEFKILEDNFGLTRDEKKELLYNSLDAAFLIESEKEELRKILDERL